MHRVRLWGLGLCIVLTISLGLLVRPVLTQTGMVTGSVVNVRSGPGTQYSVAGSLYKDSEVQVLSQSGDWYKVQCNQVTGWLHQSLLKLGTADSGIVLIVSRDQVNLRSGPGTSFPIVGEAARGEALTLIDVVEAWYKAKTSTGKVVYIRSDMTSPASGNIEKENKSNISPENSSGAVSPSANTVNKVPSIVLDGQTINFEVAPAVENNRVLVPLRAIFEAMGATVTWNQVTQTATATMDNIKVILPLNSTAPTVNGKVWPLDVPAKVVNQRTLAPLRFVGEALGGTATWDGEKYEITLTSPQSEQSKVVAVVITADTVNLRSDPVVNNNNLAGSAKYGDRLKVLDNQNGWYQVSWNGEKVWVAGWLVDVVREGEPSAAPDSSPIADPTPAPSVTLAGLTISSEKTTAGLRIVMDSGKKLSTDMDEYSTRVVCKFADRQIEGPASLQENLGTSLVSVVGSNLGDSAVVTIQFPAGTKYVTSTEEAGKRQVITIPNYIASVNRKTFGNSGENIILNGIAPMEYSTRTDSTKLEVIFADCLVGQAQASYKFNSSLISGMNFKSQAVNGKTNTVLTIITSKPAKFAVGTTDGDCTLNIMFVDKSLLESRTPIVVLDAGHGGRDPGASGDSLSEKEVNLKIALRVGKILSGKGLKVVYTRQNDTYVGLDERTTLANLLNAAVFVSVHQNANISSSPSGTETYCYYPVSEPDLYIQKDERYNLALRLQEALVDMLGRKDRGVKEGNLAVLRESEMPSALVEMVFISNPEEEALLKKDSFLEQGSQAIAEAIVDYMKSYVDNR